jgi:hypothetical protein
MKWSSVLLGSSVVALLGLGATGTANAAPITGHIGFSGGIVYDTRPDGVGGAGLATLDFYDSSGMNPDNTPGAGDGSVFKIGGTSGYFLNISNGSNADIHDLTNDPSDDPPSFFVPAGVDLGPAGVANFLSNFSDPDAAAEGLHFDITQLLLQPGPACTGSEGEGDTCVEGPFSLKQTAGSVHVDFDILGYFRDNMGNEGFYSGAFGTTFNGLTFAELFDRLDNTGQDLMCGADNLELSCTLDANFDPATVPEPASMLTFGVGSAVLAMVRRRRSAKAAKAAEV